MQQVQIIKWIVELFPRNIRGILAILLIVLFALGTTVLHLYREQDRMQIKLDKCHEERYQAIAHIKDSLAVVREKVNHKLEEQNAQLRQELAEIRNLKIKLHD